MSGQGELSYWLKRQLTAFEEKFVTADKDKSGFLSLEEVTDVLRNAGFRGTDADIKVIFRFADKNKDAKVSRAEYMDCVKKAPKTSLKVIVLRRAFSRYDEDGSGFLTRDEVIAITSSDEAGLKLSAEKVAEMLLALVTDKDKKISYEEFLSHFQSQETATLLGELFKRIDKDGSGRLTKQEIVDAIQADEELAFQAGNLSQLLISFTRENTDSIDYQQFANIVASQSKK